MHVTCKRLTCACHVAALRAFSVFEILYPYLQTVVLGANVLAGQSALLPGQYSATSQGPWAFLHHKHSPTHGSRGVDRKMSTPSGKCKPRETHWAFVKFCNALYGAGLPLAELLHVVHYSTVQRVTGQARQMHYVNDMHNGKCQGKVRLTHFGAPTDCGVWCKFVIRAVGTDACTVLCHITQYCGRPANLGCGCESTVFTAHPAACGQLYKHQTCRRQISKALLAVVRQLVWHHHMQCLSGGAQ